MADEADIANDAVLADIQRRIASKQASVNRQPATHCEECDEPITSARQALCLNLCIECARLRERCARLFRKD